MQGASLFLPSPPSSSFSSEASSGSLAQLILSSNHPRERKTSTCLLLTIWWHQIGREKKFYSWEMHKRAQRSEVALRLARREIKVFYLQHVGALHQTGAAFDDGTFRGGRSEPRSLSLEDAPCRLHRLQPPRSGIQSRVSLARSASDKTDSRKTVELWSDKMTLLAMTIN